MKGIVILCMLMFVSSPAIYGQIKIGDNPQNIDPASVLELESNSRVLVITKATTDQMNAIRPQRGGLVFNTDTDCVHYYNGTQWINLCDAASFVITNDPIVNNRATIAITESTEGYNLEIAENSILGANIVDGGIGPDDIQDNSITVDKLGENSVGSSELRQNSVGTIEIIDGSIQPTDLASTIADQVLSTDENGIVIWADASNLTQDVQLDIAQNAMDIADHVLNDTDTDETNESLTGVVVDGNELVFTESGNETRVDLGDFNNTGSDNQTLSIAANRLSITNGNDVDLNPYLDNTDNQTISINGNVITLTNGGNVTLPPGSVDTDDQQLSIAGNRISLTDGGFVDLPPGTVDTDQQNLSLAGTTINITNGTGVDLAPILGSTNTDEQNLSLAGTTINITNGTGVDLAPILGDADTDDQGLSLTGNTLNITDGVGVDLTPILGGNQNASQVPFTPSGNTISNDVQTAIEELQTEIDGISLGGAANPNDELITSFALNGTGLDIAEGTNILPTVDLDPVFVTETELAAFNTDDGDADDTNELSDIALIGTTLNLTNAVVGAVGVDLDPTFVTEAELTAFPIDDGDSDDTNEIQTITSPDASVTVTPVGNNYELTVTGGGTDDQNLESAILTGTDLAINIEGGTDVIADLATLATDAEVAVAITASETADGDRSVTNEIQTITSPDASVTVTPVGNNYELTVTGGGTDDQNLESAILTGSDLAINIEGGNNVTANLSTLTTDLELVAAITASETADEDTSITNEIQTISSPNNSVTVTAVGNNYELEVAGSTDDQTAAEVAYDPTASGLAATTINTQLAIDELKTDIDAITAGENLFNTNGLTLVANRTHNLAGNNFVFDGAGNIGIGNLPGAPQDKLDVDGQIRARNGFGASNGTADLPTIGFYNDPDTGIFRGTSINYLRFSTAGSEAITIDPSQNVGIGTTAPAEKLHVGGNMRLDGSFLDKDGQPGSNGQILSSSVTGVDWIDPPTAGNTIEDTDPNDGLSTFSATAGYDLNFDDTTIEIFGDELRVKGSATDGQVLTSTGGEAVWATPAPSGGIIAMGKVGLSGALTNVTPGITISGSNGDYTVNLPASLGLTDANYIVTATILNGSADPLLIRISDQFVDRFSVRITRLTNSNAAAPFVAEAFNSAFFFTITDL